MKKQPLLLEQFLLATGKNLPYDSGKYSLCNNIEIASGGAMQTKFFVVGFSLGHGKAMLPGEVGVCLPAACDNDDIEFVLDALSLGNGTIANLAKGISLKGATPQAPNPFNVKDDRVSWGQGTSVAIAVVVVLAALVLWSTCIVSAATRRARAVASRPAEDLPEVTLLQDAEAPQPLRPPRASLRLRAKTAVTEAFSLFGPSGTWTSLWKADTRRPTDCLNGMRVLSMFFIIMGHGMLEPMHIAGYSNLECLAKSPLCLNAANTNVWSYTLLFGQMGVDTFFFIGGFLLSFVGKSRSMPIMLGTALRYARLLPLFGFVQMLYILVSPYLVFGPFAPRMQAEVFTECGNSSWWSELLFINAFYPWDPLDGGCMGWSWYLGVDMVFAILGLIFLNIWKKAPTLGWVVAIVSFFACIAVTIQQSLYWKMEYNIISASFADYTTHLYSRPYSRFPGFLVGLVAPWALDALEKRGFQRGTHPTGVKAKIIVYTACIVALLLAATCIFLPYLNAAGPGPYSTARPAGQWTPWQNALFIAWSRPVWCLCWLIWTLACYFDFLPITNAIFGHPIMGSLASLTFGAYLTHPIIIKIIAGNLDGYLSYSAGESLQRAILFAILAYSAAIAAWCLVEKPMATLTGLLVPKKKKPEAATKLNVPSPAAGISGQQC